MKYLFFFLIVNIFLNNVNARELVNANFNNLTLNNFIKLTSKVIKKNILITADISEKIDFIYNKPIYKDEVLDILTLVLESKGYQIIERDDILNIVSLENKDTIKVIYLKNTKANTIYSIIKDLEIKKRLQISVFDDINAIILKGSPNHILNFSKIIKHLDIARQQVYVQAKIIEVSERKTQNIGIEYGLKGFGATGTNIISFASSLNSLGINESLSLNQLNTYGYNLNSIKNALFLGATINLLKQNKALNVVSEPSILCLNNNESSIYVGETRSIPSGTTIGTTTTTNFKREDIGLKLIVKPRISDNNKVTLELKTTLEDIKEIDTRTGNPNTNKKEVLTTAVVNTGESVILGGLIKNKSENIKSKVPILGDIPYIGTIFRNNYNIDDKINLIIIVTPYIVPKSKDLTFIIQQLTQLKMIENQYTEMLLKNLKKKKNSQSINTSKHSENLKKHNKRLQEQFGL